jgi:Tol biopolymer transport system component
VAWSPDGRFVVFASGDRYGWDVHISRWDGRHNHRLTSDGHGYYPSFSPDGSMIVYQSWRGSDWDIWVMHRDGANGHAITTTATDETKPVWCCASTG